MRVRAFMGLWLVLLLASPLAACKGDEPLEADAGADIFVLVGEHPTFDGCFSEGDIANYMWTIVSAPDEMQQDVGKVIRERDTGCSFTLDAEMGLEEVGEWVIELEVRDAEGNTSTDRVTVEVTE